MSTFFSAMSSYAVPVLFCILGAFMLFGRKNYFASFAEGAKVGARSALDLFPTLLALLVAVTLFRASGLADALATALSPYCAKLGLPSELLVLLITRPISGGAANAAFSELLHSAGPDSFVGFCASVMMGAGDTVVYIVTVYFASVGVKKQGKTLLFAFLVMLFGIFFSCFIARIWFNAASVR